MGGYAILTIHQIDTITPQKQDHDLATYAPLIKKEDGQIDWTSNAVSVERKVRAFSPWPSAYTHFRGKRIKILDGRVELMDSQLSVKPGEILASQKEGLAVVCGDGNI